MAAQVVSLFQRRAPVADWSQKELAEFYRVENALLQAGMQIDSERGVTDDGDPWFAFCRADDGEVFIHFARINGEYLIAGPAYGGVAKGWDFASLVRDLIDRHPMVQPGGPQRRSNIFMHPAALLIAVVGTAFFKTGEAKAMDDSGERHHERRHLTLSQSPSSLGSSASTAVAVDAETTLAVVASAIAALNLDRGIVVSDNGPAAWQADHGSPLAFDGALNWSAKADASWTTDIGAHTALAQPSLGTPGVSAEVAASWLSLAVVLHDLPANDIAGTSARLATSALAPAHDLPEEAGQPSQMNNSQIAAHLSDLMLVVELHPGPLPDVAAVRFVRESNLGIDLDSGKVLQVSELPEVLQDLIHQGAVSQAQAQADAPPAASHPDGDLGAPPPPLDLHHDAPAAGQVDVMDTSAMSHDDIVAMLGWFVNSMPFNVVSNGDDLVFYDNRITDLAATDGSVESRSIVFDDGSTVVLVGFTSLVHDHLYG